MEGNWPKEWNAAADILAGIDKRPREGYYDKRTIEPWASELQREPEPPARQPRVWAFSLPLQQFYWGRPRHGR